MNKLYAIFDKKADEFDIVWEAKNAAVAMRGFMKMVKDEQNPMNKNPDDYELVQLGEFNKKTGIITSEVTIILTAKDAMA